ncbi:MAG TPA: hypothetical protein VGP93_10430 [Polyangiaceae bacterium]|nr:hypothetical protein [Polyangiaceae bacterium]
MARLAYVGWVLSSIFLAGCSADPIGSDGSGGATASGGSAGKGSSGASTGGSGGSVSSAGSGGAVAGSGGTSGSSSGGSASGGIGGGVGGGATGGVTGDPGVWENVTPDSVNLTPGGDQFGVQDVLADPANPGVFYAFICLQGVWKSQDWGVSWTHVSTDGNIEMGKPWGEAIAPDGGYMLVGNGNVNGGAWRSTDGGVTWTSHLIGGTNDPYMYDVDPSNKDHVISSSHSLENIYESSDGGLTWSDRGPSGAGASNYVFFLTSTTWLVEGQSGGSSGTRRTTNSGGSWADVGPMAHAHGNAQIVVDADNNSIYVGGHDNGIYRSTDGGASFSQVSSTRSSGVFATGTTLYSTDGGANAAGTAPTPQKAARSDGTSWAAFVVPDTMTNGVKRAATALDTESGKWVIVSGHWNGGIWRYVEP